MHDIGVMLASEYIAGAPHIGCQLVNLGKITIDHLPAGILITQIADDKIISRRTGKLGIFEIDCPYPRTFILQSFDQVRSYKPAASKN